MSLVQCVILTVIYGNEASKEVSSIDIDPVDSTPANMPQFGMALRLLVIAFAKT